VPVWEVLAVREETGSAEKTAVHFRWPRVLVARALAYAKAYPDEIRTSRDRETGTATSGLQLGLAQSHRVSAEIAIRDLTMENVLELSGCAELEGCEDRYGLKSS
jgi:hypothetical protein